VTSVWKLESHFTQSRLYLQYKKKRLMLYGEQRLFKFRLKPRIVRNHMSTTVNKIRRFKYYNTWCRVFFRFSSSSSSSSFSSSSSSSSSPPHHHHPPHHSSLPHPPPLFLEWHFNQLLGHGLPVARVSRQLSVHA